MKKSEIELLDFIKKEVEMTDKEYAKQFERFMECLSNGKGECFEQRYNHNDVMKEDLLNYLQCWIDELKEA